MAFFEWDDRKYSVGIREMDQQHRQLLLLLNRLYEAMYAGDGREALEKILAGMLDYTRIHFAAEERLMMAHGYPEYRAHREVHMKMTRKVVDLHREFVEGGLASPVQISNFLKNWLIKHIMGTDRRYSDFLKSKGVR